MARRTTVLNNMIEDMLLMVGSLVDVVVLLEVID
jgi:hypothetical protein